MFFMMTGLWVSSFPLLFSTCRGIIILWVKQECAHLDVGRVSNSAEGDIDLPMEEEVLSLQRLSLSLQVYIDKNV